LQYLGPAPTVETERVARSGELTNVAPGNFTGVGSPDVAPQAADIRGARADETPEAAAARFIDRFLANQAQKHYSMQKKLPGPPR